MFYYIVVNIGGFKSINDLMGFQEGNYVLSLMASRLRDLLTEDSKLARHTGPEFSVILKGSLNGQVKVLCELLHQKLSEPFSINDERFKLPISIGVSCYPEDGMTADDLINRATVAMHRAKEGREAGVRFYHKDITLQLAERTRLERDLSRAIEMGELEVHYQPQITSNDHEIIGVEALARWRHSKRGVISPEIFIPIAETTGMIVELGSWILRKACEDVVLIYQQTGKRLRVGVNLSAIQFAQPDISETVAQVIEDTGLPPQYLELELTESCLVEDINSAEATLKSLKSMGVNLSIDDFGTGYSSLSYLKHFAMDRIKIDRSFVNGIDNDADLEQITSAIVSMAKSLNMSVIAEGVETEKQLDSLKKLNCEELQGFYFSKPVQHSKLVNMLKATDKP